MVQNGCHNPELDFAEGCECTIAGGYYCWHMCTENNCNEQVNLYENMLNECEVVEGEDDNNESSALLEACSST